MPSSSILSPKYYICVMNYFYYTYTITCMQEEDKVLLTVRVTHKGEPCVNHEVEVRTGENQGRFSTYLDTTDENGCVTFEYVPYYENEWTKAGPITITVLELSNSIFVEVNVIEEFNIIEVQPLG